MSERLEHNPQNNVSVLPAGTFIFVELRDRAAFDRIALPMTDHGAIHDGHVLTKCLEAGALHVIFQYWLTSRTLAAVCADMAAARETRPQ